MRKERFVQMERIARCASWNIVTRPVPISKLKRLFGAKERYQADAVGYGSAYDGPEMSLGPFHGKTCEEARQEALEYIQCQIEEYDRFIESLDTHTVNREEIVNERHL